MKPESNHSCRDTAIIRLVRGGKMMIRKTAQFLRSAVALIPIVGSLAQAQPIPAMTHHVREVTLNGDARMVGRLPANQLMNLDIVLPLSDSAGLDSFLADVYNPSSPSFRKFITSGDFTQRFGPTQSSYNAVLSFAKANGLRVTGGSRNSMEIQVQAPVSAVESAFHLNMGVYQHPTENRTFYAPDREPTTDLSIPLWHISGLDNYSIPQPQLVNREEYAASQGIAPETVVKHATTGSGPSASFLGSDMRAAYYGGSLKGEGQNLGLLEFVGTDLADVDTYYANIGQTNTVPITLLSVDGTTTACLHKKIDGGKKCNDVEQTLDITQALGMAPRLATLTLYIGSSDTAIIAAMTSNDPLPATIGCSWGWKPVDPSAVDPYFRRMAAQGQTFFVASGDDSTWTTKASAWPADDLYIVSVGGTDLVTTGPGGAWASETAWTDSGGGVSPNSFSIPEWQQIPGVINSSNQGSTTFRNGPDVAANADFTFYVCANQKPCTANVWGGTSFAAPMWAGFLALANQKNGSPLGFINPTIYAQNVTLKYAKNFHDITSGVSGSYTAVPGYDLVTGWGSPAAHLIDALVGTGTESAAAPE